MAQYRISGIWKNDDNVITHYAFHTILADGRITRASKTTKADAIKIVEATGNTVITWLWDYSKAFWKNGETVHVVNAPTGKYLRSNRDSRLTDNLNHLINFDWIIS